MHRGTQSGEEERCFRATKSKRDSANPPPRHPLSIPHSSSDRSNKPFLASLYSSDDVTTSLRPRMLLPTTIEGEERGGRIDLGRPSDLYFFSQRDIFGYRSSLPTSASLDNVRPPPPPKLRFLKSLSSSGNDGSASDTKPTISPPLPWGSALALQYTYTWMHLGQERTFTPFTPSSTFSSLGY